MEPSRLACVPQSEKCSIFDMTTGESQAETARKAFPFRGFRTLLTPVYGQKIRFWEFGGTR